jgi:hypothetical protein
MNCFYKPLKVFNKPDPNPLIAILFQICLKIQVVQQPRG